MRLAAAEGEEGPGGDPAAPGRQDLHQLRRVGNISMPKVGLGRGQRMVCQRPVPRYGIEVLEGPLDLSSGQLRQVTGAPAALGHGIPES